MLVVKIELHPGGDERRAVEIGRVIISNVGGSGVAYATYAYEVTDDRVAASARPIGTKRGYVEHERARGAWALLHQVLDAVLGGKR